MLLSVTFLVIDLSFFGANLLKITGGGWYPIALALVVFTIMTTWRAGRRYIAKERAESQKSLEAFIEEDLPEQRVPGVAVFVTGALRATPSALQDQVTFNGVAHETLLVLTIRIESVPRVPASDRCAIHRLDKGVYRVLARYGYLQVPRVSGLLRLCQEDGVPVDPSEVLYFVGRETAIPTRGKGLTRWRAALFSFLTRVAVRPSDRFGIPHDRVVELGVEVEL
jgi:KUP system potassium uptake protein